MRPEHHARLVVLENECSVGKLVEIGHMVALCARVRGYPLAMKLRVDRVCSDLAGMQLVPDRRESVVVLAPAERARAVSGGEGSRVVEEEQLGEAARLEECTPSPSAELEPTGDPALAGVAPTNAPVLVVKAPPVSVHEATSGIRHEIAERRYPVLQGHCRVNVPVRRNVRSAGL